MAPGRWSTRRAARRERIQTRTGGPVGQRVASRGGEGAAKHLCTPSSLLHTHPSSRTGHVPPVHPPSGTENGSHHTKAQHRGRRRSRAVEDAPQAQHCIHTPHPVGSPLRLPPLPRLHRRAHSIHGRAPSDIRPLAVQDLPSLLWHGHRHPRRTHRQPRLRAGLHLQPPFSAPRHPGRAPRRQRRQLVLPGAQGHRSHVCQARTGEEGGRRCLQGEAQGIAKDAGNVKAVCQAPRYLKPPQPGLLCRIDRARLVDRQLRLQYMKQSQRIATAPSI